MFCMQKEDIPEVSARCARCPPIPCCCGPELMERLLTSGTGFPVTGASPPRMAC